MGYYKTTISLENILNEKKDEFIKELESRKIQIDIEEIDGDLYFEDLEIEIDFSFTAPSKGLRDSYTGAPLEPDEPAMLEDIVFYIQLSGGPWDITDFIYDIYCFDDEIMEYIKSMEEEGQAIMC